MEHYCNYSVLQRDSYMIHRRTHSLDPLVRRPFPCSFPNCENRAPTKLVLKSHCKTHHDPHRSRDISCALCPKAFFTGGELKSHIVFCHTREKHYSCDQCAYMTGFRGNLTRHYRSMRQQREQPLVKKLKCEFCDYCADRKCHFNLHVKTVHTEQRDFQCDYPGCNYETNNSYYVRIHTRPDETVPISLRFPRL